MAANRGVIPPIPALREAGCPIALGTDNNTNDVFEVMRIALLTERIRRTDPFPGVRPQPEDILADATEGGSRAVNQQKTIGSLEVGKKADLFVLDTMKPYLVPAGRLVSAVIHGGHPSRHRIGDGRRRVHHAQQQGVDDGRGGDPARGRCRVEANLE